VLGVVFRDCDPWQSVCRRHSKLARIVQNCAVRDRREKLPLRIKEAWWQSLSRPRTHRQYCGTQPAHPACSNVEQVNDAFRKAAQVPALKGGLDVLEDQWASSRLVVDPHSSIVDLPLMAVQVELLCGCVVRQRDGLLARVAEKAARIAEGMSTGIPGIGSTRRVTSLKLDNFAAL
jgi:hypothetical protein